MPPRSQIGRKDQLRGLDLAAAYTSHSDFIGIGNVFDNDAAETDLQELLNGKTVAALGHSHNDSGRPVLFADLAYFRDRAQTRYREISGKIFAEIPQKRVAKLRTAQKIGNHLGQNAR